MLKLLNNRAIIHILQILINSLFVRNNLPFIKSGWVGFFKRGPFALLTLHEDNYNYGEDSAAAFSENTSGR
jgi:hypothetical protein